MPLARALFVTKYPVHTGGVEVVIDQYAEALEARGVEIGVVSQEPPESVAPAPFFERASQVATVRPIDLGDVSVADGLRFVERSVYGVEGKRAVAGMLDRFGPDVVVVFSAYHHIGFAFLAEARRRGVPTVLSAHDYKAACASYLLFDRRTGQRCEDCLASGHAYLHRPIVRACAGSRARSAALVLESVAQRARRTYAAGFDRIIVVNSLQRRAMVAVGAPPASVHVLPHHLPPDAGPGGRRVAARSPVAAEGGRRAVFVGRLSPEKGVEIAIRASALAGVPLDLYGDGPLRASLEALALSVGAPTRFLGWRPHAEVVCALRDAEVLVVPSLWPEVAGLVVGEATAAGVPVIASAVGGIAEQVEGLHLVAPGDSAAVADLLRRRADLAPPDRSSMLPQAAWRARLFDILDGLVA